MTFWTFLIITLGGPFEGYVSVIPMPSMAQCGDALEAMDDLMWESDAILQCRETDQASGSIRPMARPVGVAK